MTSTNIFDQAAAFTAKTCRGLSKMWMTAQYYAKYQRIRIVNIQHARQNDIHKNMDIEAFRTSRLYCDNYCRRIDIDWEV